ncbi:MAG: FAD:protein FMN transferase [Planctomycetaceae bacterium]|nr:FAD:protein FMN transferase [Planctomycetaceae bacterium]
MDQPSPTPSRREFLTGRAMRQQVEAAGDALADAVVEAGEHVPEPVGYDTIRLETRAMACPWSVILNPGPPKQVMVASDTLDLVHDLEDQMTVYRDTSELSRINAVAHESPQGVEARLFHLLLRCRAWCEETAGAFDPTSGPLIGLWRRCRDEGRIPTGDEILETRARIGMERVTFDTKTLTVSFPSTGFQLDLGAIGKGYAIDRAAEHMKHEGVQNFLVHGGHSSLFAAGDHYGQGGWPVGIKNPLLTERRYATLLLDDCGLSTSGSNIQYFRYEGRRYGHILDPRTGWPAEGLLSVTVLAPTAAEADALSTAFYVMGLEKAEKYCHNRPEIGAILVPPPPSGTTLTPVVLNIPEERLFFVDRSGDP